MWYRIERTLGPAFHFFGSLNRNEWIALFIATLVVGYFCMKGFGSRANY